MLNLLGLNLLKDFIGSLNFGPIGAELILPGTFCLVEFSI